jgi:hypothetical protein
MKRQQKTGVRNAGLSRQDANLLLEEDDGLFRALLYTGLASSAIIRTGNLGLLVLNIKYFTRTNV